MPADLTNKNNAFVTRTTDGICSLLDCYDRLQALYEEYVALNYGELITDEVLAGSSSQHLDHQMWVDGFASIVALQAFMAAGHNSNFMKFRR